jgi:hypothetical protein
MAVGGWIVREYINIFEVVAMVGSYLSSRAGQNAVLGSAIAMKLN